MRLGMLFVMAFWSGPSRQAFGKLLEIVREHDSEGKLRVVVADTDCIPEFYKTPPYKGRFHGWGETFWVKDGVVVSDSGVGLNLDCIKPNTLELLELAD